MTEKVDQGRSPERGERLVSAPESAARKRANVRAAAGNFRMILNLSKNVDWNSDVDISSIIEIARLARAGLSDLGFNAGGSR